MSVPPPQPPADDSGRDSPPPQPPAGDSGRDGLRRDARLGAALSGLPVPDHSPAFWADLSTRLAGLSRPADPSTRPERELAVQTTESRGGHRPPPNPAGPAPETPPVSLEDRRARRAARRGRTGRSLGAAAAAVAVVVAAAGAVAVVRDDGPSDRQVRTADRPSDTSQPAPGTSQPPAAIPTAPAEFFATYDGIEGRDGPDGCCSRWQLTLADDGSFRWTSTDGRADMAYDAAGDRHVNVMTVGPGNSAARPNYFQTLRIPEGGPDQRFARPEPLGPLADFVVALARAGDSRITTTTVSGRPAWHYDGPTAVDRLGGDGAPNHAVADVDQASGVLLALTTRADELVVSRFTAADVTTRDTLDRSRYRIEVPPGAQTTEVDLGFTNRTLDDAAGELPYPLLVPGDVPSGFTLESVQVNGDVASPTGPEGMNPPVTQVAALTWRRGAIRFTVTLRPTGGERWDNPFGAEGVVADAQPVRLALEGRPPLEGTVAVDAPLRPHLWGITGDVVVTVSGDLSRAELERVAAGLRPHGTG